MKKIVVAGGLPHARMHDDGGFNAHHLEGTGCVLRLVQLIMSSDHVPPPGLLNVALELYSQWTVIPQTSKPAVDLGGLKSKPASLTERDNRIHQ